MWLFCVEDIGCGWGIPLLQGALTEGTGSTDGSADSVQCHSHAKRRPVTLPGIWWSVVSSRARLEAN